MQANGAELDLSAFKARLRAAREFDVVAGEDGIRLRCLLPSPIDERLVASRFPPGKSPDRIEQWLHELAIAAVVGWDGVHVRHVVPEDKHGDMLLPCTPDTARLLLDFRLDLNDLVGDEILRRRRQRDERMEEAAKNSAGASIGSDPEAKRSDSAGSETPSASPS